MFNNPFSFEGRIRRTEYGLSAIINFVLSLAISTVSGGGFGEAAYLMFGYIPLLWFTWAQGAKRCHDLGKSGWWQLIPFYALWLIFQDGQPGPNQYGSNPKGIQNSTGQTYYVGSNNSNQGSINPQNNSHSGYQGGYNGGHNSPNNNFNQAGNAPQRDGYKNGDLYN